MEWGRGKRGVHELVFETLSNLATESQITHIKKNLARHNAEIERDCQLIQAEITKQHAQLDTVKQKKEQYLDSLITGILPTATAKIKRVFLHTATGTERGLSLVCSKVCISSIWMAQCNAPG